MSRAVLAVAVVGAVILLAGGAFLVDAAIEDSEHRVEITNETFEPVGDTLVELNGSQLDRADYDPTITVRDSDGAIVNPTGNYTWYESNGTLYVNGSSYLDNQNNATASYGWFGQEIQQDKVTGIVLKFPQLFGVVALGGLVMFGLTISLGVLKDL